MGLEHNKALMICVLTFLAIYIPCILVLYRDKLFPKIDKSKLLQHIEYQKEQRAIEIAEERYIKQEMEELKRKDERERMEQQRIEWNRITEARRLAARKEQEEQDKKDAEYKAYINFVFSDPFYKTGQRRVKTTDAKVYGLWQQAVERLDSGASIHSVVIDIYRMSSSGPTYTAYHKTIEKLYHRHKEYIERNK